MKKVMIPSMMSKFLTLYKNRISQLLLENGFSDVDPSYGSVVNALYKDGIMTMKALAAAIDRDKSTVTVLVRNLEKNKVVEKIENEKDQRSKYIRLTAKGLDQAEKFAGISKELNDGLWHNISDEEGDQVIKILDKMMINIRGEHDE